MVTRRSFLRQSCIACGLLATSAFSRAFAETIDPFKGKDVFDRILAKALREKWDALPIGQCMGRVARELEGTPYVGFTLEISEDQEVCSINLTGLDCVTFFEDTLCFSRMLKKGGRTPSDMLAEVTHTRYRGGKLGDFTSRLQYTTDWFLDNQQKNVVTILTPDLPGAVDFDKKVSIMSHKPESYRQLKAHPDLIPRIAMIEDLINARAFKYIPLDKLKGVEEHLQTGDIVGITTSIDGIDISHTGLVYVDEQGVRHFMDASSSKSKMKVTLEKGPISEDLKYGKNTGAMFARPREL